MDTKRERANAGSKGTVDVSVVRGRFGVRRGENAASKHLLNKQVAFSVAKIKGEVSHTCGKREGNWHDFMTAAARGRRTNKRWHKSKIEEKKWYTVTRRTPL